MPAPSPVSGYVNHIDAEKVGLVSMHLGGGRETKDSDIDLSVGVLLLRKVGDRVEVGESLEVIHAADEASALRAAEELAGAYSIVPEKPVRPPFIRDIIR